MQRCLTLLALVSAVPLAAESGGDYLARVSASAWFAEQGVSGQDGFDPSAQDWENSEVALMLEASVRLPILFDVHGGYYQWATEGSGSSELSYADLYLEMAYGLDVDRFGASVGLAAHFLGADIDNGSASTSGTSPILCLSARAFFQPLETLNFEARVHALSVSLDSDNKDLGVFDWQLAVGYYPTAMLGLQLGYRSLTYTDVSVDAISTDGTLDSDLAGPFLGAMVQW